MDEKFPVKKFAGGDVYFLIEQESSIHLKATDRNYNDPVELTANEARKIGEALIQTAEELKKLDEA
jgi:hypothetical protein